jgi:hypothetical protein
MVATQISTTNVASGAQAVSATSSLASIVSSVPSGPIGGAMITGDMLDSIATVADVRAHRLAHGF